MLPRDHSHSSVAFRSLRAFHDMRVGGKIYLAVVIVILVAIGVGGLSIARMNTLNDRLTTIKEQNVDGLRHVDAARGGIEKMYSDLAFFFATTAAAGRAPVSRSSCRWPRRRQDRRRLDRRLPFSEARRQRARSPGVREGGHAVPRPARHGDVPAAAAGRNDDPDGGPRTDQGVRRRPEADGRGAALSDELRGLVSRFKY